MPFLRNRFRFWAFNFRASNKIPKSSCRFFVQILLLFVFLCATLQLTMLLNSALEPQLGLNGRPGYPNYTHPSKGIRTSINSFQIPLHFILKAARRGYYKNTRFGSAPGKPIWFYLGRMWNRATHMPVFIPKNSSQSIGSFNRFETVFTQGKNLLNRINCLFHSCAQFSSRNYNY